ncbi:hypothetical protein F66182_2082 [Fusarium sp. NRRL 66182]|nr:hypothetical protein F66182_2082 [Fusarium sp. NRRL 66182]
MTKFDHFHTLGNGAYMVAMRFRGAPSPFEGVATIGNPNAWDQIYRAEMRQVQAQSTKKYKAAKRMLMWLIFAQKPLSRLQLRDALAMKGGELDFGKHITKDDIEEIAMNCGGFVFVDSQSISLVQSTVQDFFLRTRHEWFPDAENLIAGTCLAYLSALPFQEQECNTSDAYMARLSIYPFYQYAALHWGHHASRHMPLSKISEFLALNHALQDSFQVILERLRQLDPGSWSFTRAQGITGLHICAYFGLNQALRELLRTANVDDRSIGMTPLQLAARVGQSESIKVLVEHGADLNLKDPVNSHTTSLHWAVRGGHADAVRAILDLGRENLGPDPQEEHPLLTAASRGHADIVEMLVLSPTFGVHSHKTCAHDSLNIAILNHDVKVVQVLVSTPDFDLRRPVSFGAYTHLNVAARTGSYTIFEILYKYGKIDAYEKDEYGWNALFHAADAGRASLVHRLLEIFEADESNNDGRTPLSIAAGRGELDTVKVLFQSPSVNPDSLDLDGHSPLYHAVLNNHHMTAQFLKDTQLVNCNAEQEATRQRLLEDER